ncbi:MAG: DNA gyrase subunit A [Succinivibrionaceae bacterium]|nr:DNA gyrase subunit A [Succinivibrionaceae bacterium]
MSSPNDPGQGGAADPKDDSLTLAQSVPDTVTPIKMEDELKQSFINYAMSVIVDRALPDVRDGLKPVHRRVIYDMYDQKIWSSGETKKSAKVVGDVIGRFHPHGDVAVYETIVRMAQWFSMREPLIFGQGNFGNIDGDGAAAMRYTEIKMTRMAETMLSDIDKETVDTYPNYDGSETIPWVLPTRFPNLLVNGSAGIAVGMATNIPTHNLGEVIDGCVALLDNPALTLEEMMEYIKGPDFPTGGLILGKAGIREAYATGRGRCVIRARHHVETDRSDRKTIIIDEIPFAVSKASIVRQIAELVRDKKIEGISEINDLSDKRHQVRIAIDLKRDAYEEAVLNNLYEHTDLQSTFGINMVALLDNQPRIFTLMEILREFLSFRREVVTRRTVFLLRRARHKAFIDESLIVARGNTDRLVEIIKGSENREDARNNLMAEPWDGSYINTLIELGEDGNNICNPQGIDPHLGYHDGKYFLSAEQANAILDMQLVRLTHFEIEKLSEEYRSLVADIKGYLEILTRPERMREVIREELIEVKERHGNPRRSDFTYDAGSFDKADLIARQDVVITLSAEGYIKYQDISTYNSQHRGGQGRKAAKLKDQDYITRVILTNTHDYIMCFTSRGRAFATIVYDLPTSENRTWRGRPVQNTFKIEEGEYITALLPIPDLSVIDDQYLLMATNLGKIKKTRLSEYRTFLDRHNGNPIKAIALADDEELIGVSLSSGDDEVFIFSSSGMAARFCEFYKGAAGGEDSEDTAEEAVSDEETAADEGGDEGAGAAVDRHRGYGIRPSGRGSGSIRAMRLQPGARAVSLIVLPPEALGNAEAMVVASDGFGKRMRLTDLRFTNRGSQGVKALRLSEGSKVIGACSIDDNCDFLLITNQGQLMRSPASDVRVMGRQAHGVTLMRTADGEELIALVGVPEEVKQNANAAAEARRADRLEQLQEEEQERLRQEGGAGAEPGAGEQDQVNEGGEHA